MKKLGLASLGCLMLSACNTMNVQYVDATGQHGSGTADLAVDQSNGKFSIADKGVTCSGTFPSWRQLTVVFPIACTDGKSGTVTMTRPFSGPIAGEGTMQLTSGETRRFTFGRNT